MKSASLDSSSPSIGRRFLNYWHSLGARSRIFIYFLIYALIMLLVIWFFQVVFLVDFYKAQTKYMLSNTSGSIARNIGNDNLQSLIERYAEQNNICITIMDENLKTVSIAEGLHNCLLHRIPLQYLVSRKDYQVSTENVNFLVFPMEAFRNQRYDNKKFIGTVPPKDDGGAMSIISVQKVSDGNGANYYIFLNAKLTPLEGTVSTLRNELVFITVILLILSFLISWLLSKRITRPIIAITEASASLAERQYTPVSRPGYREVQQLNERLTQTAVELQKVDLMQKELIANISHDLRTPLTLIQGYAEMIRDIPGEGTPENMQVIIDEAKRLSTLVEAVLNLNCLRRGQIASTVSDFSADESISAMAERYNQLMQKEGYTVLYEHNQSARLHGDKLQFEQVLQNLVNNALTYTGIDKTVTIRQTVLEKTARFEIIDTGEGIAEDDLAHIWERYYRSGKPHKRAAIGSGLGLSIVQSILKNGGLDYGVTSKEGEGSNFWFEAALTDPSACAADGQDNA